MTTTLIKSRVVLCLDDQDQIYEPGYLVVENNTITEIGHQNNFDRQRYFDQVINLGQRLVMPGLINTHTHSPMTLFRGHVEGHTLFTLDGWYNTIRVLEMQMTPDMIPPGVAVSCAEMIRTGTTCFVDQYFWMDRIIPVVRECGLRAVLAYGIVELGDETARQRELSAASQLLTDLAGDERLYGWVGPHAFFVDNSEEAMRLELELARTHSTGFHTHFATGQEENDYCRKNYGHSAIQQLQAMGFLDFPIIAAHSIAFPLEDLPTVQGKAFTVAMAPSSGMRNAAGLAPLLDLRAGGVNVALGTDNVTNNNSYDMFKEMALIGKLMALLHKDPAALPARDILRMATINGARAIGRQDEIGSLEIGKKADLIALDLCETGWCPTGGQDYHTALVYAVSGYHVRDVMVDGRWVFRDNQFTTLDYAQEVARLDQAHADLMEKVS